MALKIRDFEDIINRGNNFAIIGHFNPDGDSVGSVSAMSHYLESIGKNSAVILPSAYPPFLKFLDADGNYLVFNKDKKAATESLSSCDTMICLDFNKPGRTEDVEEYIRGSRAVKILVDHHPMPETDLFDLVISDTGTSSTCELLFWLLLGTENIGGDVMNLPFDCAQALGTGMLTDTNNFNNSTIASTFQMASLLTERGVSLENINRTVFGSYSENRMRLMGAVLDRRMTVLKDLNAAFLTITAQMQKEFDFQIGDSEGFVNLPLLIREVEVSALFVENEDYIRVSLRSKGGISVNKLSNMFFNGGGHDRAAGGRLYMKMEDVPIYFESSLKEFMEKQAYDLQH